MVLIQVFGSFNALFALSAVLLERDWVTVIAGEDSAYLRQLHSTIKQVDVCSSLLAPCLVALLQLTSYGAIAVVLR